MSEKTANINIKNSLEFKSSCVFHTKQTQIFNFLYKIFKHANYYRTLTTFGSGYRTASISYLYRLPLKNCEYNYCVYSLGLKTKSTYKSENMHSSKNVNANLKVGYLKCQGERKLEGLYTSVRNVVWGAIGCDWVQWVRLFDRVFRRTTITHFFVNYVFASGPAGCA